MTRAQNPNLEILMAAVDQLCELADKMIFVGGCATGLLITDPAAPPIRVTRDVDAIVQVISRAAYYRIADELRIKGFSEDTSDDAPLCRWISGSIVLDVMPTASQILGFGNPWYESAARHAERITLPSGKTVNMVSAPYFLITKLEAFEGRGRRDYLMSHDLEDIVAVLDGRPEIIREVQLADSALSEALAERFHTLLQDRRFIDAVSGHMPADAASQARVPKIIKALKALSVAPRGPGLS